ncbi:hypothetical protein Q5O12_27030, partial [Klebsiella pneumoniae]|uniref:hypothetical protein n=1 Tax=Klebsiella pneumoniae TaxID=573 RepID=UPI0027305009
LIDQLLLQFEAHWPQLILIAAASCCIHRPSRLIAKREIALLSRFTAAHPRVPLIGVPSLPFEVSDLEALRAVGDQLTRKG